MALDTLARAMAARADSKAKTAYQYAVEGGYTGTEEQFTEDMGKLGINAEAVDNAVRFDIAQAKTELQKLQAQANIGLDTTDGDINAQLALRALITGYYEAMGVGTADNLTSSQRVTDEEPYNYRTTGGNVDVGSQENFKSLVGGTLAINQIFGKENKSITSNGITIAYSTSTHKLTITVGEATGYAQMEIGTNNQIISGHKYFICTDKAIESGMQIYSGANQGIKGNATAPANRVVIDNATSSVNNIFVYVPQTVASGTYEYEVMWIDLTTTFGTIPQTVGTTNYASIADYVYALGQTNGIAWLYKYFPILNGGYIPYSAPNLASVCCDKHITTGLNQEPKAGVRGGRWTNGTYSGNNGNYFIGTDSKIRVFPNTQYTLSVPLITAGCYAYFSEFDINGNFLRTTAGMTVYNADKFVSFTTSADAYFVGWYIYRSTEFTADEAGENCFALTYDGEMDGVYEPYEANTYDMGHDTLRGIYMLDSFGNLFLDPSKNDTKTPDGEITRRRNYKKLSDLTWVKNGSAEHQFYAYLTGADRAIVDSAAICNRYANSIAAYNNSGDKFIWFKGGTAWIIDSAYSDAASLQASLTDVYADYLAETPTTESGTEYTELQKCHNWGTEELTDYEVGQGNRVVSIPVGHVTEYPVDLKAKLETTPTPPLEDGSYIVQVSNGEAQYVPLGSDFPEMPTTDGTYSLKATVSSGTATMSWVADT